MSKKYARLGKGEFGECYHVILAHKLNPNFCPKFDDFQAGVDFYKLIFGKDPESNTGDEIHLGETANWIWDKYHPGVEKSIWKKISELAEKEGWKVPKSVSSFRTTDSKLLVWLRSQKYKSYRNISLKALEQIRRLCASRATIPVFVGPKLSGMKPEDQGIWDFYNDDWFKSDSIAKQLWVLNSLFESSGVVGSLGMMSGAMDGLAFFCGRKTLFIARKEDATPRMIKVVQAIPNLHWIEVSYQKNFERLGRQAIYSIETKIWGE